MKYNLSYVLTQQTPWVRCAGLTVRYLDAHSNGTRMPFAKRSQHDTTISEPQGRKLITYVVAVNALIGLHTFKAFAISVRIL